jgi:hypothetical protein
MRVGVLLVVVGVVGGGCGDRGSSCNYLPASIGPVGACPSEDELARNCTGHCVHTWNAQPTQSINCKCSPDRVITCQFLSCPRSL